MLKVLVFIEVDHRGGERERCLMARLGKRPNVRFSGEDRTILKSSDHQMLIQC
jgi:hypothetical protein